MLSREAVAAALALAGIRTGAHVLDLGPAAGLSRAARAAADPGRVDVAGPPGTPEPPGTPGGYSHALAVFTGPAADDVLAAAEAARPYLAPHARVLFGSGGELSDLVDALYSRDWRVLHTTTVPGGSRSTAGPSALVLASALPPA